MGKSYKFLIEFRHRNKQPERIKMAKTPKIKFPEFNAFACIGDSIQWENGGFDFSARLEFDGDTDIEDFECFSKKSINSWKNDEWFFVGVVVSVELNGVLLSDHSASLWGIECNFPSRRKNPNKYLSEVAKELEGEAMSEAILQREKIIKALG